MSKKFPKKTSKAKLSRLFIRFLNSSFYSKLQCKLNFLRIDCPRPLTFFAVGCVCMKKRHNKNHVFVHLTFDKLLQWKLIVGTYEKKAKKPIKHTRIQNSSTLFLKWPEQWIFTEFTGFTGFTHFVQELFDWKYVLKVSSIYQFEIMFTLENTVWRQP